LPAASSAARKTGRNLRRRAALGRAAATARLSRAAECADMPLQPELRSGCDYGRVNDFIWVRASQSSRASRSASGNWETASIVPQSAPEPPAHAAAPRLSSPLGILGAPQLLFHLELEVVGGLANLIHQLADLAADLPVAARPKTPAHHHQDQANPTSQVGTSIGGVIPMKLMIPSSIQHHKRQAANPLSSRKLG